MRLVLLLLSVCFFASYQNASGDEALRHNLSIAGGIAHPSESLAISQNPAGLIYPAKLKTHFSMEQGRDQGPVGFGGGLLLGTETVGGGIYLRDYNTDPASVSKIYLFDVGLGVLFEPLNAAIGIGASKTLGRRDPMTDLNSCSNWCIDAGILFNPRGPTRIATNVIQISDSNYLLGGGVARDVSEQLSFVLDAQVDTQKATMVFKPGLGIFIDGIQLTGSYGFRAWGSQEAGIRQGWSAGVSTNVLKDVIIEVYLNQFTYYYFGVTLNL
jgi:hypothetical protein